VFVTAQGSPLTRFPRAVERESLILAEIAATEAGYLGLDDALRLTGLYASAGDPKFDKAAVRWLARFALEADRVTLAEMDLAAVSLAALPARGEPVLRVLLGLVEGFWRSLVRA
jgi:hypothetical protein